jgi:predicted glycosyltransferase
MKPIALLYCQHSLGLGHFVRSLTLAEAVAQHFDVTFFNGGPVPQGFELPSNIRFEHLPPLRLQEDGMISGDGDTASLLAKRRDQMLAVASEARPAILIVELYPFGRKKFAVEIDPLIAQVRADGGQIICSVRDVLVNARVDQARHDNRAAATLNAVFDHVLVHTDPQLFDLSESFRPSTPLITPVSHTGYVVRNTAWNMDIKPDGPTLVSAGGGAVGHALYHAAIAAQPRLWAERGWSMTLVAGPLFPEQDWHHLHVLAEGKKGLTLVRSVPSMAPLLGQAGRFVGQCGYNSALEVCQSGLPALFVPFARGQESEQTMRAKKLKELKLADWIPETGLSADMLADKLLTLSPPGDFAQLDLSGAETSARLLKEMALCKA